MKKNQLGLNEKDRRKIIEYITTHQGCNIQEVIREVKDYVSRVTVFNILDSLEKDGAIRKDKDKPNSRDRKLFVDTNNPLVSVPRELQDFEEAFVNLLQKTKKKILERDFTEIAKKLGISESNPYKWNKSEITKYQDFEIENFGKSIQRGKELTERTPHQLTERVHLLVDREALEREKLSQKIDELSSASPEDYERLFIESRSQYEDSKSHYEDAKSHYENLFSNLRERSTHMSFFTLSRGAVIVFYSMIDVILFRSTVEWPNMINDKETLRKLYVITYTKVAEIQIQLSKFLKSTEMYPISNPVEFITNVKESREELSTYIPFYWWAGMQEEIERVIYCISNLALEIKRYGYDPKIDWPPSFSSLRLIEKSLKQYEESLKQYKESLKQYTLRSGNRGANKKIIPNK